MSWTTLKSHEGGPFSPTAMNTKIPQQRKPSAMADTMPQLRRSNVLSLSENIALIFSFLI